MATKVILADDHVIVREGLKNLLSRQGIAVVAEAGDGLGAVRQVEETHPEVAVLDLSMPGLNGLDAARVIMKKSPRTKTIVLTQHGEKQYILEALKAGVNGYVHKSEAMSDLVRAIGDVKHGRVYLSPSIWAALMENFADEQAPPPDPLTPREKEVLQLIVEGKSSKMAAQELGITAKTVESHRSRIMIKLGIHDIASLVRYAIRRGLIQP
jgi:DNA-binding NarL/FixJ family response regulator